MNAPAEKQLLILESPFKGDVERNLAYAWRCLRHSLDRGEAPIASHLLYPQVLDDDDPVQRALGIEAGLAWRRAFVYTDFGFARRPVPVLPRFYVDLGWSDGMRAARRLYLGETITFEVCRIFGPFPMITRRLPTGEVVAEAIEGVRVPPVGHDEP